MKDCLLFGVRICIQSPTLQFKSSYHKEQHRPFPSKPLFYTKQHQTCI